MMDDKQKEEYIIAHLHDDRAKAEAREMFDALGRLEDADVFGIGDIRCNIEAIFAYETGEFTGNDYFAETYWENFKNFASNLGERNLK